MENYLFIFMKIKIIVLQLKNFFFVHCINCFPSIININSSVSVNTINTNWKLEGVDKAP